MTATLDRVAILENMLGSAIDGLSEFNEVKVMSDQLGDKALGKLKQHLVETLINLKSPTSLELLDALSKALQNFDEVLEKEFPDNEVKFGSNMVWRVFKIVEMVFGSDRAERVRQDYREAAMQNQIIPEFKEL